MYIADNIELGHLVTPRRSGRCLTAALCAALLTVASSRAMAATTWNVPGDNSNTCNIGNPSCSTIQGAVNAASAGDTISVGPATYNENVTINKNVALLSTGGRAVTTITGTGGGPLGTILVTGGTTGVQIGATGKGFTINGIDGATPGIESAAIYFQGSHSNAQVRDNEIVANGDEGLLTEFGATISGFIIDGNEFSGQTFVGSNPADFGFANQFTTPNVPRQLVVIGCGNLCANTSSTTFTNNTVTGTAGGCNAGGQEQGNNLVTIDSNGATITGNVFMGTTSRFATSFRARGAATTISGNTFDSAGLVAGCATPIVPVATGHVFTANTGQTESAIAGANTFDKGVYVDGPGGTIGLSIQAFVNAVPGGTTIVVLAGSYAENVALNKQVTLNGARQGVAACGRVGVESVVSDASAGTQPLLTLLTGSAGSIIDGFSFSGGNRAIESQSGPIDNLQLLDNRIGGFTGSGIFLNDNGIDVTVHQNSVDGTSKVGAGDLVHLDQDTFSGFRFTSNCVANGPTATGFFVDGNHNVKPSAGRTPLFSGNLITANQTGANLGRFAFTGGTIITNTFSNNTFDGLQGGIQSTSITGNNFTSNGRHGLALTGFSGSVSGDSTRGAQNDTITNNCVTGNGFLNNGAGISYNAFQFPGTISTNVANQNNIAGNKFGALYTGSETINAKSNWWGCPSGANTGVCDTASPNVDTSLFLSSPSPSAPCGCTTNAQCVDSLVCNGSETCNIGNGMCQPGSSPDCSPFTDQCNTGVCVEPTGCQADPLPNNTVCSATPDTCSLPDTCQGGVCADGGGGDTDVDGICNADDNCPAIANPGQEDVDGDGIGNPCDDNEGPMNLTFLQLKRAKAGKTNGGVTIKGDLITSGGDALNAASGINVAVKDSHDPFTVANLWSIGECVTKSNGRIRCISGDHRFKGTFKPFSTTPGVFRFVVRFRSLATPSNQVFEGPVTVRLSYGPPTTPPPPSSPTIDKVGVISDCRATGSGLKCRAF